MMTASKPNLPPKGRAAAEPKVEDFTDARTVSDPPADPRQQCDCPEGKCGYAQGVHIDLDSRFCRDLPHLVADDGAPNTDLLKRLASIIVEENGDDPNTFYLGKYRWEWTMPQASAFARMFSLMVQEVAGDDE